ncbi:MAG: hypothetical protein PWR10_1623 [Halanaerobiales bacterium]|nr:hypothetical protein [Halanaerobiales bacterium]
MRDIITRGLDPSGYFLQIDILINFNDNIIVVVVYYCYTKY